MKLAEALQERADLNRRIAQINSRLSINATVQEGEQPAEDPQALLAELDGSVARLQELIARINLTNCTVKVSGKTLTELIAEKDCVTIRLNAYQSLITSASALTGRATRSEIKILSAVNVRELRARADGLAKELRTIDNRIQETNWLTELM